MILLRWALLLIVTGWFSLNSLAQTGFPIQGVPRIIHYTKKDFNADPQFWTMCQDKNGVLYFGNNNGTLVFDGERWQKVLLPNNSSVRSLQVNEHGEVYAGGFNELGVIRRDPAGTYYYESLINLLRPEDRNLENIWQIHEAEGYIIFRSTKMLIALANNKALTIPTSSVYRYSTVVDNKLYVLDDEGIKQLDLKSMEFSDVVDLDEFNREEVVSLLPGFENTGLLLITKQGNLYAIDAAAHKAVFLKRLIPQNASNLVICAIKGSNGVYYFGTLSTKVILLGPVGESVMADETFQSLQDKTVLNLFESNDGNIWALLNNGIDYIDISSPMSIVFENAAVFDVLFANDKMYLATNQGVFVSEAEPSASARPNFRKIEGLEGQTWSLQFLNGHVICSHDRGLFILSKEGIEKISGITGVWKVIPVKGKDGYFFACTYDAIYVLHFDESRGFVLQNKLEGFNESARDILQADEPGVFWICHGYKGVFRIKVSDDLARTVSLEHFKDQNGLPSVFSNNVFRWKNEIIFTTDHGLFTFNAQTNQFQQHPFLTNLFGTDLNVRKLYQQGNKTWFIHNDEAGYFFTDSVSDLRKDLFLGLKGSFNQGMECIVPVGESQVLLGTNTGLYAFDLNYAPSHTSQTRIASMRAQQGSTEIAGGLETSSQHMLILPHGTLNVRFDFAAPGFHDRMNIQYSYKLDRVDDGWSAWQSDPFKEFSYLRPGRYVFHVKARSLLGERAAETAYYFEILPAWYQTRWAYGMYSVVAVLFLFTTIVLVNKKIERETNMAREEEEKKRKVLELELEQIKLKQEKEQISKDKAQLEEDVIQKSKELANYTMLLVKKRELLTEMHEDLKILKESTKQSTPRQMVRDLIKKITSNLQNEEHIQVFEANFERVHHQFFSKLKSTFADLSPKELQLCAFVRMNLTNKEIASISNISVRGVETARYRLRKRLGMSHEQDMAAFLEKLHSSGDKDVNDNSEE